MNRKWIALLLALILALPVTGCAADKPQGESVGTTAAAETRTAAEGITVTEEEPYAEKTILDHSSGEIATKDADVLMDAIRAQFNSDSVRFYTGTSYRHIMVWKQGKVVPLEPPHDHLGTVIGPWLPKEEILKEMMEKSYPILNVHPLNLERARQGKHKANSLWFWGAGTLSACPWRWRPRSRSSCPPAP